MMPESRSFILTLIRNNQNTMERIVTLLLLMAPLFVQAQPQLAFDTTSTQNLIVYTGTVTANGDRVLAVRGSSGTVLWRSQADGTPVWARQVGQGAPQLIADGAGGVQLLQYIFAEQFDSDESDFNDTLREHYGLTKVDGNGEVAWARKLSVDWRYAGVWPTVATPFLVDGENACFVVFRALYDSENGLAILKIDDQGQLLWTRSFTLMDFTFDVVNGVTGDGNGGLYFSLDGTPSLSTKVVHLLADGTLDWQKKISYTNAAVYYNPTYDMVTAPDGSLVVLGAMSIPDHFYLSTIRLSPQGTVTDAHFYTPPPVWGTLSAIKRMDDGRLLVAKDSVVIALAADGEVEAAASMVSHVDGDQRNRFIPMAMDATPQGAVLSGVLDYVHVALGYTHHRPSIRTIDPYATNCYTEALQVVHVPVPTWLYQVEDYPVANQNSMYCTIADTLVASTPVGTLTTTDLCTVMIAMGVPTMGPRVYQDLKSNVVQQGTAIAFVADDGARRVNVIDAAGRCLVSDRLLPAGEASLQTREWHTGIYLLRVSDADGTAIRTHRVLVIP